MKVETEVIRNWEDLSRYGIEVLTSEACSFNARFLCRITQDGREILEQFLGVGITAYQPFPSQPKPFIGEITLGKTWFNEIALACLAKYSYLYVTDHGVIGADERLHELEETAKKVYIFKP